MQYDNLIYTSGPNNIKNYVSNKYNIVHNQLYEDALYNYVYNFTKNQIIYNLLYNLFVILNTYCIVNDLEDIININKINTLKNNTLYKIFSIEEIYNNQLYNETYINNLKQYIDNNEQITNVFHELNINYQEKYDYIIYIIVNIISLIQDIKQNIQNIIYQIDISNNFSDFIIKYKNNLYIIDELELTLFKTEISDNEIFIYEDQYRSDFHLGFNKDGYFILDINPDIDINNYYDSLYYIISYVNNLLFNILFNDISNKYINSNIIIEKPNSEYYLPSSIIIYENQYPHKKKIIDLTPYWSTYNDYSNINISDIKYNNESINDAIIDNIDYVNGTVKIYSKSRNQEYIIDTKYINGDTEVDTSLIDNTFIQKII